jgi:hypothetical protein
MSTANPYDVNHPGKFDIGYAGLDDGFYCFRLEASDKPGFDFCMFQMEVSQWLFDNTQGRWHMGNDFPYKDHPAVRLHNHGDADYFVLLERFSDVVQFENTFPVLGITPSMLTP